MYQKKIVFLLGLRSDYVIADCNCYEIKLTTNTGDTWSTLGSITGVDMTDPKWFQGVYCNTNDDSVDATQYITSDIPSLKAYINEIKDAKERNDNMEILELYERKVKEEITERYARLIKEEYENLDVVKEYNELINTFAINMKQLAEKYNTNDNIFLIPTCYNDDYSYELSDSLWDDIEEKYIKAKETELKQVNDFCEEVKAVLSLSEDKDYQVNVLKNYEILDKKGKLNI